MSRTFQTGLGDWTQYRAMLGLSKCDEIDLHFDERTSGSFEDAMAEITVIVKKALCKAQANGRGYVMFVHGWLTSRPGRISARSQVRGFMRSSAATPLIERRHCIQHATVFVARVRTLGRQAGP